MNTIERTTAPTTPATWHWAITPQQVDEIKQGNRDTINVVYFDNLTKFRRIVGRFCGKILRDFVEDCLQQIYVDLPAYNFANVQTFFRSVMLTLRKTAYSRVSAVSFEQPIAGTTLTLQDVLVADDTDEQEEREKDKRLLQIIDTQQQLTTAQKDYLVAVAYACAVRGGLYEELRTYCATI